MHIALRLDMSFPDRHDELDDFKTQIDLCDFASDWAGFVKDVRQSSRCSAILRHANGDKLIVARTPERHHIFFNVHDASDRGSIIDFVQSRENCSLGAVRKILRPYLGRPISLPKGQASTALSLVPSSFDVVKIQSAWLDAQPLTAFQRYLQGDRQITRAVLDDPKFRDRVRVDHRGNAIFPHWCKEGLSGFEVKNSGWTGFSPGGLKGLWISRPHPDDRQLIFFETAIDALSLACLEGTRGKRFVSTAGQMSPMQIDLVRAAIKKMPDCNEIVLAMDNDEGGDRLVATFTEVLAPYSLPIVQHRAPKRGADWNDVLKERAQIATDLIPDFD